MRHSSTSQNTVGFVLATVFAVLSAACGRTPGEEEGTPRTLTAAAITLPPPLKTVPVPEPEDLGQYIKDKTSAIALGKALFWDMQIGSDGKTACATCHFHAGADSRSRNSISPGVLRRNPDLSPNPDNTFQPRGVNYQLRPSDYPFHKLADVNDRASTVLADTNDVAGSQGVTYATFVDIRPGSDTDVSTKSPDPDGFRLGGVNVRRVEPRNTPSVINAVFNVRQFWDGRAQEEFNGVNSFGDRDPYAFVYRAVTPSRLEQVRVRLKKSSLASQALAPPLSSFEMSADGRTFAEVGDKTSGDAGPGVRIGKKLPRKTGKKLGMLAPLALQKVDPQDGVLGKWSNWPNAGLKKTYGQMIEAAFEDDWWKANRVIRINADGSRTVLNKADRDPNTEEYTLSEYNFGLIFGLAIQLYEATLVSDDTPFDRFVAGDTNALDVGQKAGMELFFDAVNVRCVNCHGGAEFTDASFSIAAVKPLRRRDGNLIDRGFNNIGVRATLEDLGIGDTDPWGKPLSWARLATLGQFVDPTVSPPVGRNESLGDDGGFKAPGLRNVELTAPYFHNGGTLTLRQVMDFYSRGGDVQPNANRSGQTIAPVQTLRLTDVQKDALVAFLRSLTDERVRHHRAPFDHPQIFVPNGHVGTAISVENDGSGSGRDVMLEVPAVGRNGTSPFPNFLDGEGDD